MTQPAPPFAGPLHIDTIHLAGGGRIGMSHCPGRCLPDGRGRAWRRELGADLHVIAQCGFASVLTLLPDAELAALGVPNLGARVAQAGMVWHQLPIADFGVPDALAQRAWATRRAQLSAQLQAGQSLLVHCAAGLGRTGTMVALLLKAMGQSSAEAVATVRAARPGTIETPAQLAFVNGIAI